MKYHHHYNHHRRGIRRPRSRTPSPPPQNMTSAQAVQALTTLWSDDSRAWKPASCNFSHNPSGWPPRMLVALAELAQASGFSRREQALRMVEETVQREGRGKATPEIVNRVREKMESMPREVRRRTDEGEERLERTWEHVPPARGRDTGLRGADDKTRGEDGQSMENRGAPPRDAAAARGMGTRSSAAFETGLDGMAVLHSRPRVGADDMQRSQQRPELSRAKISIEQKGITTGTPASVAQRSQEPAGRSAAANIPTGPASSQRPKRTLDTDDAEEHTPDSKKPKTTHEEKSQIRATTRTPAQSNLLPAVPPMAAKAIPNTVGPQGSTQIPNTQDTKKEQSDGTQRPNRNREENKQAPVAPLTMSQRKRTLEHSDEAYKHQSDTKKPKLNHTDNTPAYPSTSISPPLKNQSITPSTTNKTAPSTKSPSPLSPEENVMALRRRISEKDRQILQAMKEKAIMSTQINELKRQLHGGTPSPHSSPKTPPKGSQAETVAKLELDLELAHAALAAQKPDADAWRARQDQFRYLAKDHMRLSRLEFQTKKKNEMIADLRKRLRAAEKMYTELDNETWNVWKADDHGVKVVQGDEGMRLSNAWFRRDNERLRLEVERLKKRK